MIFFSIINYYFISAIGYSYVARLERKVKGINSRFSASVQRITVVLMIYICLFSELRSETRQTVYLRPLSNNSSNKDLSAKFIAEYLLQQQPGTNQKCVFFNDVLTKSDQSEKEYTSMEIRELYSHGIDFVIDVAVYEKDFEAGVIIFTSAKTHSSSTQGMKGPPTQAWVNSTINNFLSTKVIDLPLSENKPPASVNATSKFIILETEEQYKGKALENLNPEQVFQLDIQDLDTVFKARKPNIGLLINPDFDKSTLKEFFKRQIPDCDFTIMPTDTKIDMLLTINYSCRKIENTEFTEVNIRYNCAIPGRDDLKQANTATIFFPIVVEKNDKVGMLIKSIERIKNEFQTNIEKFLSDHVL